MPLPSDHLAVSALVVRGCGAAIRPDPSIPVLPRRRVDGSGVSWIRPRRGGFWSQDSAGGTPPPAETNLQIKERLRATELVGVSWDKTKYIDCLRDMARELRLRIVMHPDVLKFNTVEAVFPKTSADALLRQMTFGFDCEYILHKGEVVIIKAIKRNDKRLEEYREALGRKG